MAERGANIQGGTVLVSCPNCGAEDYEVDDVQTLIAEAATLSIPCDECPARIEVFIDMTVQALMPATDQGGSE